MAVSTHRWRPKMGVKSGYVLKNRNRKVRNSKQENCIIELKFENSSYFVGVKNPVDGVYNENKMVPGSINRFASSSKLSGNLVMEDLSKRLTKKLYVSEYVEAKKVANLTKLNDPSVRGYIISADKSFLEEACSILEMIKIKLSGEIFNSFRLIIVPRSCDISLEILRNIEVMEVKQKPDYISGESEDRIDSQLMDDEWSRSTNTTMDEDAEEKLRIRAASNKFRDSRILLVNRPKPINTQIDPVEKCFLALTKMFEDNIFSAAKGLTELHADILKMAKVPKQESIERINSIDSTDIDFKML